MLLEVDLDAMGAAGLDRLERGASTASGRPSPLPSASSRRPRRPPRDAPPRRDDGLAAVGRLPALAAAPVLVQTAGRRAQLAAACGGRLALTLESLRALRTVPGVVGVRLEVCLPTAPRAPRRGQWN